MYYFSLFFLFIYFGLKTQEETYFHRDKRFVLYIRSVYIYNSASWIKMKDTVREMSAQSDVQRDR